MMMDRWEISLSDVAPTETEPQGDPMPYNIINNYFSVGVVSPLVQVSRRVDQD